MKFWSNRYTIPGWILTLSLVIQLRYLPIQIPYGTELNDIWSAGIAVVALVAGMPLGFIVYSLFEFFYRSVLDGTGMFVDHEYLRKELIEIFKKPSKSIKSKLGTKYINRINEILNNVDDFEDRSFYTYTWRSFAPKDFREGCHQRWESFHVAWAVIFALLLSLIGSVIVVFITNSWSTYIFHNWYVLIIFLIVFLLLIINSLKLAHQAAEQENLFIQLFLAEVSSNPRILLSDSSVPPEKSNITK